MMIVTSSKTLTEQYWGMVNKSSSSGLPASNRIAEQVGLPAKDLTAGTPCIICPSRMIREAIDYHDLGLMDKLTHKITTWLRKHAD